jgi:hypothetical protein
MFRSRGIVRMDLFEKKGTEEVFRLTMYFYVPMLAV